jgi:hypothetical protein
VIVCPDKEASVYGRIVAGSSKETLAEIKDLLRKTAARSKETLGEAIGVALSAVSVAEARAFFEHAGYHHVGQLL